MGSNKHSKLRKEQTSFIGEQKQRFGILFEGKLFVES